MSSLAPICLDYTLHDLYATDNEGEPHPTLIYDIQPMTRLPSAKFAYHNKLQAGKTSTDASIALLGSSLMQRRCFLAGNQLVIILESASSQLKRGLESVPEHHTDIYRNFAQLRHDQQPILSFVTNPDVIALELRTPIAVVTPIDPILHLPHLVEPEMHYEILSKRGLARSGLPTPQSTVIDMLLPLDQLNDPVRLQREIVRMTEPIDTRRLPFVVKLPQSVAALGTFTVSSEADRARVKAILDLQMRSMLKQINAANYHLHPCSLVLQDFIQGTEEALSFFMTRKGNSIFVCCSVPRFDDRGHWSGGYISYADQPALEQMYAKITEKVARFLHQKGYCGPVGMDVITDNLGEQYILDLNPRLTGSYHLGFLKGHFVQRGLEHAVVMNGSFPGCRTAFEDAFAREVQNGSLIITGWAQDDLMQRSCVAIIAGGRESSGVERLHAKVRAYAASRTA